MDSYSVNAPNDGVNRTQKGGGENWVLFFRVQRPPPFRAGYAGRSAAYSSREYASNNRDKTASPEILRR
jgi:hypothetical protein